MITMEQACGLYCSRYPTHRIKTVLDARDEWIISGADPNGGILLASPLLAFSKETGEARIFFPPDNVEKFLSAKVVLKE